MKAFSARQEANSGDLMTLAGILGITTPEQAFAVIERYYSMSWLTAKASIFVQSLLGAADYGHVDKHAAEVFVSRHMRNGKAVAPYWRKAPAQRRQQRASAGQPLEALPRNLAAPKS